MRELERNREQYRRMTRRTLGQNPRHDRTLAFEAANLSTDADLARLPVDLASSGAVQDSQGRFLFVAGFDDL